MQPDCTFQCVPRLGRQDGTISRLALSLCTMGAQKGPLLPCNFPGLINKMLQKIAEGSIMAQRGSKNACNQSAQAAI